MNLQKGQVKIIRSDNKEFFIDNFYWKILENGLQGIDTPPYEIFTQKKAVGVGDIVTGKRLASRDITIEAEATYSSLYDVNRQQVLSFFNPLYEYKIYICYNNETRWINAELTTIEVDNTNIYSIVKFKVIMYCKDGLFKSVDNFNKDIASKKATFYFPLVFKKDKKVTFAEYLFSKEVLIENDGEYPTFIKAVFNFNGEVTNPTLYKDDKFVKVNRTFNKNDIMVIDLEKATVFLNDKNITQDTDRQSNFVDVELSVGENTIKYGADSGDNLISCTIFYDKLYGWV